MSSDATKLEIILAAKDATAQAFGTVRSWIQKVEGAVFSLQGAFVGLGAAGVLHELFSVNKEFDGLAASLQTVTGSAAAADSAFATIQQFATQTPYQLTEVTDAFIKMKSMGLDASVESLTSYGNTASAMGKDLNQMIEAVADAATGEFERLKEFGIKASSEGDNVAFTFRGVTTTVGKNASEIEAYLKNLGDVDFAGGMARQMDTVGGKASNMADSWDVMVRSVGDAGWTDLAKESMGGVTDQLNDWSSWVDDHHKEMARAFGVIGGAVKGVGKAAVFVMEKTAAMGSWVADISAAFGMASAGLIDYTDIATANREELRQMVAEFDADPMITQLKKQREELEQTVLLLERQAEIDKFDPEFLAPVEKKLADTKKNLEAVKGELDELIKKASARSSESKETVVKEVGDDASDAGNKVKNLKEDLTDLTGFEGGISIADLFSVDDINTMMDTAMDDAVAATKQYEKFILDSRISAMEKGSDEYNALFVRREMAKWADVKGITEQQLDEIQGIVMNGLIDSLDAPEDVTKDLFKGITENFTKEIQTELSGIFTDTLRGELDSFEDYFSRFTDSLSSMWGSMAAKMVMENITGKAEASISSYAAMGVAGVAIGAASYVMGDIADKKAEKRRRAALREQLESELGDALAELKLDDVGYSIYQLNDRIEQLSKTAVDAGYPMTEIIELRKLETEELIKQSRERYDSLTESMTDWWDDIQTQDFSVSDWMTRYNALGDDLAALDQNAKTYQDDSIEILTDQFDILQKIYQIQEAQLTALDSTSDSLTAQIWDLQHSDAMPVTVEDWQSQYSALLDAAWTYNDNGYLDTDAIGVFQGYVTDYVDMLGGLGYDYNDLVGTAVADLSTINEAVVSESEMLTMALGQNTDAVDANTSAILAQLQDLIDTTQDIANDEAYSAWLGSKPNLSTIPISDLDDSYAFDTSVDTGPSGFQTIDAIIAMAEVARANNQVQAAQDWAGLIDTSQSQELADWYAQMPDYNYIKELSAFDLDSSGAVDVQEMDSVVAAQQAIVNDYVDWINSVPTFGAGGWTNTLGFVGEEGFGEHIVPDYQNPSNENYLRSVGMDQVISAMSIDYDKLAAAIVKAVAPLAAQPGGVVEVKINDEVVARATQRQLDSNGDFVRSVRDAVYNN